MTEASSPAPESGSSMATDNASDGRERRAATNQSLFRGINERENEIQANELWLTYVCECAGEACAEQIELTPEEYERVREKPTHFFVAPNEEHVVHDVERVVEQHERYWVVEKEGEAAAVAEQLDRG
jgi:hypothetical protein